VSLPASSDRVSDELDVGLLLETVEVERNCCPFLEIEPQSRERPLRVSVAYREQDPALDAIVSALGLAH